MDISKKEVVKFKVEQDELFNTLSKEKNKQLISESHSIIPSTEINDFKISHSAEVPETPSPSPSSSSSLLSFSSFEKESEVSRK